MNQKHQVTTTSARKPGSAPGKGPNVTMIALGVAVVAVVLILLFSAGDDSEEAPPPTPTPTVQPTKAPAAAQPAQRTPVKQPWDDEESSAAVVDPATPDSEVTTSTSRNPCINFRWNAGLRAGVEEPLDVAVTVTNGCPEDLDELRLVFVARGYRGDQEISSARGTLSGQLKAGSTSVVTITLPAKPGGYDRVDLQPFDAPE